MAVSHAAPRPGHEGTVRLSGKHLPLTHRGRRGAALRRGYDLSSLRARQLTLADFKRFDLLLAMDQENLEAIRGMAPPPGRDRARLFLSYAPDAGCAAVPDPYYGGPEGFETVLDLAEHGCRSLFLAIAAQVRR